MASGTKRPCTRPAHSWPQKELSQQQSWSQKEPGLHTADPRRSEHWGDLMALWLLENCASLCFEGQAGHPVIGCSPGRRSAAGTSGTPLSPSDPGKETHQKPDLPVLSAKSSFRHRKNADDTFVSLCVQNCLMTKTQK